METKSIGRGIKEPESNSSGKIQSGRDFSIGSCFGWKRKSIRENEL